MADYLTLDEADVAGKRVLLRLDLNVPMTDGIVTDATRIDRIVPTLKELSERGAKTVILSHFDRPKGKVVPEMSLRPVAAALTGALAKQVNKAVTFAGDCTGDGAREAVTGMADGDILLLENVRFHPGEEKNDPQFARDLAANGDLFVNDAFSAAHRAHASTEGVAHILPSYAGRAMQAELEALSTALENPAKPVVAVVGGAKVSTKLDLLANLIAKVDTLIIGGGMANTFLAAGGVNVGKSLCEHDLTAIAQDIMAKAADHGCHILLPTDALLAEELKAGAPHRIASVHEVGEGEMILDTGPDSLAHLNEVFDIAKTVLWNGPLGVFEMPPFDGATVVAARRVAELTKAGKLVSVAGGGDTVAALNHAHVAGDFTYVSTAGGAFLEWLEGKDLPGVAALAMTRAKSA